MDEGQCFRCGRVPRLCVCPEGVLESPPPRDTMSPAQRRALERLVRRAENRWDGLELTPERLKDWGCTPEDVEEIKVEFLRHFPKLTWIFDVEFEINAYSKCPRRFEYGLLKDGEFVEQESEAIKTGTEIHEAIETLLRHGLALTSPESPRSKVSMALRLAKLQAQHQDAPDDGLGPVDADVSQLLKRYGIEDIDDPPAEWQTVTWRGRMYLLSDLQDENRVVTPFGLAQDWPALTPDQVQDDVVDGADFEDYQDYEDGLGRDPK